MKPNQCEGFRFLWRHLGILVVFFAIFVGILAPVARALGARGVLNPPLLLLVTSPWVLGLLVLALERKSPVKFWAAPLLLSLIVPALAIIGDWLVVANWGQMNTTPHLLVTFAVNILLLGTFTFYVAGMSPRRCPECRSWAMIPVRSYWEPAARTPNTRWCASCGAKYWRTSEGEWKQERRRTWLDLHWKERSPGAGREERPFDTDSRIIAPVVGSRARTHQPHIHCGAPARTSGMT
jgi:hypothetical protein